MIFEFPHLRKLITWNPRNETLLVQCKKKAFWGFQRTRNSIIEVTRARSLAIPLGFRDSFSVFIRIALQFVVQNGKESNSSQTFLLYLIRYLMFFLLLRRLCDARLSQERDVTWNWKLSNPSCFDFLSLSLVDKFQELATSQAFRSKPYVNARLKSDENLLSAEDTKAERKLKQCQDEFFFQTPAFFFLLPFRAVLIHFFSVVLLFFSVLFTSLLIQFPFEDFYVLNWLHFSPSTTLLLLLRRWWWWLCLRA